MRGLEKIAWEGDIYIYPQTFRLLDQIGQVGRFGENQLRKNFFQLDVLGWTDINVK